MDELTAIKIASQMHKAVSDAINTVWSVNRAVILLDYDEWYTLSPEWDINIWAVDASRIYCDLYPVVDGNTQSLDGIKIA